MNLKPWRQVKITALTENRIGVEINQIDDDGIPQLVTHLQMDRPINDNEILEALRGGKLFPVVKS